MRRFEDVVINQNGQPVPNANVSVFLPGTTTTAVLYSNDGLTTIPNPVVTNSLGVFSFFVASGKYDFQVSGGNIGTYTQANVQIDDIFEFKVTDKQPWQTQTLEFSNQASGQTPTSGNVNLYSKTLDKNLYYKDDTGREVGPLSGGVAGSVPSLPINSLQKNSQGIFGAANATDNGLVFAINEETQFRGPVPWYDLRAYGGTTSTQSTTASCTSGSATITLAAAQDFVNGQGLVVYRCGSATNLTTLPAPTVTSSVAGSTNYNYCLVAEDRSGGLTPCSPIGSTTTGPAVLGKFGTAVALTQVSNTAGVATYTCSGNCNVSVNFQVNITGFIDLDSGVRVVVGTPTANTFTTYTANIDGTTTTPGSVVPFSANILNFPSASYSGSNTLRYWVYRNNALAGVAVGLDPYYVDFNQGVGFSIPAYVPLTAPPGAQNGYLATTILSGGGTTSLTLVKNASASTSGQTVLHDNSVPLLNLMQTAFYNAPSTLGPPIYLASGLSFNGTTDMVNGIATGGFISAKILLGGFITLNQPWIMRAGVRVEGQAATSNTAFQADASATIVLNSHPGFYILPGSSGAGGYNYSNILFASPNVNNPYTAVYSDLNAGGGGVNGIILTNINATSRGASSVVMKGAFGNIINGGTLSGDFFVPPLHLTNSSVAVTGTGLSQAPGNTTVNGTFFGGVGIQLDCLPNPVNCTGGGDIVLRDSLMENVAGPLMAFYGTSSNVQGGVAIINSQVADNQVGGGTAVLEAGPGVTLGVVNLNGVFFGRTLFLGSSGGNIQSGASTTLVIVAGFGNIPPTVPAVAYGAGQTVFNNNAATAINGGRFLIPIATPAAPISAVVSAGGGVPVDTYRYWITVQDIDGFESIIGPPITGVITTPGNQTVTITRPTLPAGATAWFIYRQATVGGASRVVCGATPASLSTIVDTQGVTCGNSSPNTSFAASTAFSSNGIYTNNFRLANSGFAGIFNPVSLTSTRSWTLPDISGTFAFRDVAQTWTASQTLQGNLFFTGVVFTNLGTPANGALIYCSDCTVANPCTSGGSGAFAKRLNAVWVCN